MSNYNTFNEMAVKAATQSITATSETNLLAGGSGSTNLVLGFPQNQKAVWDGKSFALRITGFLTTDATATGTLKVYYSATSAGAKTTQIGAATMASIASTTVPFLWMAECIWDSTSQVIYGAQYGQFGTTLTAYAVLTNPVTSLADITAGVWFQPTITVSAVTTAATVKITDFSLDVN